MITLFLMASYSSIIHDVIDVVLFTMMYAGVIRYIIGVITYD